MSLETNGKFNACPRVDSMDFDDGDVWCYYGVYNVLVRKKPGEEFKACGSVPFIEKPSPSNYRSVCKAGDKIYLIPEAAGSIAVYDTKACDFKEIELLTDKVNGKTSYYAAIRWKHYIFAFGFYSAAILRIDTEDDSVRVITDWYDRVRPHIWDDKGPFFRNEPVISDGRIYNPCWNANGLLTIDPETLEAEYIPLGTDPIGYCGACADGEIIRCVPRRLGEPLASYNVTSKVTERHVAAGQPEGDAIYLAGALIREGRLHLYPFSRSVSSFPGYEGVDSVTDEDVTLLVRNTPSGSMAAFWNGACIETYDQGGVKTGESSLLVNLRMPTFCSLKDDFHLQEYGENDLEFYLDYVVNTLGEKENAEGTCNGENIYEHLKER